MSRKPVLMFVLLVVICLAGVAFGAADPVKFVDSFEAERLNDFPVRWVVDKMNVHMDLGTGPRVVDDIPGIPDGTKALKFINEAENNGGTRSDAYLEFPEIQHGRLEFSVYQPEANSSNFGIKPFQNGDRVLDFWLSGGGALRLPNKDGEAIGRDTWHTFAFEWDMSLGELKVYQLIEGDWVEKSPEGGYGLSAIPNRLAIDCRSVEANNTWGAVDNVKLIDLDLSLV